MKSWKEMIDKSLKENNETWSDVISNTMTEDQLDVKFDNGLGGTEGIPFTIWTLNRVYFPVQYDGAEWVGSVSRHPDGIPTNHQGGG